MSLLFIPEALTPLSFTPLYAGLSQEDRVAYNQLHGLYFLEQTIFFEQIMGRPALDCIIRIAPTETLRQEARDFAAEEDAHSLWFRTLLREVDPATYQKSDFHLLTTTPLLRGVLSLGARALRWLPALLWLQLISEERAVYFGRAYLHQASEIDPRFLAVQKKHLADEPAHIRRDELFLRWLWPATPAWLRKLNARWLHWMIREFFTLPRRSGWRVMEHWLTTRPHLQPRRAEFRQAMDALASNSTYLRTLYPRRHLPRTTALGAPWPEMAFLVQLLTD